MSTVKTNNVQIGQSVTATNNFTWYQPSTPDGTVRLGNGNSGSVTDLVTLTSAGNLGIGTSSPGQKLEVSGRIAVSGSGYTVNSTPGLIGAYNGTMYLQMPYGNNLQIWKSTTDAVATFDQSGNLGLGVTPSAWATLKAFSVGSTGSSIAGNANGVYLTQSAYYNSGWKYSQSSSPAALYQQVDNAHSWHIAPSGTAGNAISFTQAMTLESGGNLLLGTTTNSNSGLLVLNAASQSKNAIVLTDTGTVYGTSYYYQWFLNSTGGTAGSIAHTAATTVAYQTGSDFRLKKNIVEASPALGKVNQMLVRSFDWKGDNSHVDYGFIAQELYSVFPDAVGKGDDSVEIIDAKQTWQVEYGRLTPILVKAIQELSAELNELKQKVNA